MKIKNKFMLIVLMVISIGAIAAEGGLNCIDGDVKEVDKHIYPGGPNNNTDTDGDGKLDLVDCAPLDPTKWAYEDAYLDTDNDDLPEQGPAMEVCSGTTTPAPAGWTWTVPPPYDPCPNDPQNTCGTTNPTCTITATASGHTVDIDAVATYANGTIIRVEFFSGSVLIGTDNTASNGWGLIWPNVPNGTYNLHASCFANDGKSATSNTVSVTVGNGGTCSPYLQINGDFPRTYYGLWYGSCFVSIDGQDPWWQYAHAQTCRYCEESEEVFAGSFNLGYCEFSWTLPSGLNGNPNPSIITDRDDPTDFAVTGYCEGTTTQCENNTNVDFYHALTAIPTVLFYYDCVHTAELPVSMIWHQWGSNFIIDFTGAVDPEDGDTINVIISTPIDSDGDGFPNACPPSTTCTPDNCIRFENPTQTDTDHNGVGDACTNHPNPDENDNDNDWYMNFEDAYPNDRTRH